MIETKIAISYNDDKYKYRKLTEELSDYRLDINKKFDSIYPIEVNILINGQELYNSESDECLLLENEINIIELNRTIQIDKKYCKTIDAIIFVASIFKTVNDEDDYGCILKAIEFRFSQTTQNVFDFPRDQGRISKLEFTPDQISLLDAGGDVYFADEYNEEAIVCYASDGKGFNRSVIKPDIYLYPELKLCKGFWYMLYRSFKNVRGGQDNARLLAEMLAILDKWDYCLHGEVFPGGDTDYYCDKVQAKRDDYISGPLVVQSFYNWKTEKQETSICSASIRTLLKYFRELERGRQ
jgi:hypothetical protein